MDTEGNEPCMPSDRRHYHQIALALVKTARAVFTRARAVWWYCRLADGKVAVAAIKGFICPGEDSLGEDSPVTMREACWCKFVWFGLFRSV